MVVHVISRTDFLRIFETEKFPDGFKMTAQRIFILNSKQSAALALTPLGTGTGLLSFMMLLVEDMVSPDDG